MIGVVGLAVAAMAQMEGVRPRFRRAVEANAGALDRGNVPTWPVAEKFERDLFTFARVRYTSNGRERSSYAWWTDYPDADLNLSFRLQQLTSMKVHPEPKIVELTDPDLFDYPWVIMSGAGNIELSDREVERLRTYLLNGGFLMVDDFWGQTEWEGVARAMKKVFPDREPRDLPRSHRIFQSVYKLPEELSLQTCNVRAAVAGRETGKTWEENHEGGNVKDVHFRALFDDKDRMMVFFCHNTDNGDGWEEEDSDPWFFQTFSEKKNYPLAINVLFYAMTH